MTNPTLASLLIERRDAITTDALAADYTRRPELIERYGEKGRAYYRRDNDYHVSFLAEAIANGEPALFVDYVAWARSMLTAHGVALEDLVENLRLLRTTLTRHVPEEAVEEVSAVIDAALAELPALPEAPPAFIVHDREDHALARTFLDRLLEGNRRAAFELIERAHASGLPLKQLYLDVFQRSQRELGRLWQLNRITVAQEHFCTAATLSIISQFYREILDVPRNGRRATAFCVAGELHEIGLRIVADFLELEGWDCDFIGANTPSQAILDMLVADPPDVVAISATMSYNVSAVGSFIADLRNHDATRAIPVLVGGRPFLVADDLWRQLGADGCAMDAEGAVLEATTLAIRPMAHG